MVSGVAVDDGSFFFVFPGVICNSLLSCGFLVFRLLEKEYTNNAGTEFWEKTRGIVRGAAWAESVRLILFIRVILNGTTALFCNARDGTGRRGRRGYFVYILNFEEVMFIAVRARSWGSLNLCIFFLINDWFDLSTLLFVIFLIIILEWFLRIIKYSSGEWEWKRKASKSSSRLYIACFCLTL